MPANGPVAWCTSLAQPKIEVSPVQVEVTPKLFVGAQPNRSPLLEKVVNKLNADLQEKIPDSVPEKMNNLLCAFETNEGSKEWERLRCGQWFGKDKIQPY